MASLRSKKTSEKYKKYKANVLPQNQCGLCKKEQEKLLKEFKYWRILDNLFPWDRIAKVNHLLVPKKHIVEKHLTESARKELEFIKSTYVNDNYELMAEATHKKKSIPEHFHMHLIVIKDRI